MQEHNMPINVYEVAAAAGKDIDDLDALQDSSTHSFTDVCAARAFFNCATQKISPLHTTLVDAHTEEDDHEGTGGSREEIAELYLDASFSEKRIEPILKLPCCPEVLTRSSSAPVAVSKEPFRKETFRLSRHLFSEEMLHKKEEEWAAKISAAKAEICMLCLILLGIACSNL
jgi:hypothetical protein